MDAQTIATLCCTACGALADAKCACGVSYEPLSQTQQMERRRERTTDLYKSGLTMQQIADKLKVGSETVRRDLSDFPNVGESKRPKTTTNPKGAGRPKGSKSKSSKRKKPPGVKQAQRSIDLLPEVWEQVKARAIAANMPAAEFIGQLLTVTIDPTIDPKTLSKSGQDKLAAAIRQHKRQLDREYDQRRTEEIRAHIKRIMPTLQEDQNKAFRTEQLYREYLQKAKKLMTVAEFTLVCSLLHPDSRISASEERLRRAFQMFEPKKFALTGEK